MRSAPAGRARVPPAREPGRAAAATRLGVRPADLAVGETTLWLYDPRLLGAPGHERLYAACEGKVVALSDSLEPLWRDEAPGATDFVLSPDAATLYGLVTPSDGASAPLRLEIWETAFGIFSRRSIDLAAAIGYNESHHRVPVCRVAGSQHKDVCQVRELIEVDDAPRVEHVSVEHRRFRRRQHHIRREFDVRLRVVSVGRLLKKMGLSPQKPQRRA